MTTLERLRVLLKPVKEGGSMTLKIEIKGEHTRADTALWLQEIVNAVRANRLDPDIRKPIRDFNGREIGYAVFESDIKWPDPMTLGDE